MKDRLKILRRLVLCHVVRENASDLPIHDLSPVISRLQPATSIRILRYWSICVE
jgi:hypothetical protein